MTSLAVSKSEFPVFSSDKHQNLSYFDSASTCLTPKVVAEAVYQYQCFHHGNSQRGLYQLSAYATELVNKARQKVARFIDANDLNEIVFTSSATHSINLVAQGYVKPRLRAHHNIIISAAEHHANLLPWQILCHESGAKLLVANLTKEGVVDLEHLNSLIDEHTLLVAINHVSNVLGTCNEINKISSLAHKHGAKVLVDGAQAVSHQAINMQTLACDFYVFSSHKMYGISGCGVLYSQESNLKEMTPLMYGGGIIDSVDYQQTHYKTGYASLEAGSLNVAAIVGLTHAIDFIELISWQRINAHFNALNQYLAQQLAQLPFISPLMSSSKTLPILSFTVKNIHCHDIASLLDQQNVAVRAGHHCAQPLHKRLHTSASVRVSLGLYNDKNDIDRLVSALKDAHQLLG